MGPPTTRSRANSPDSRAIASTQRTAYPTASDQLAGVLGDVDDQAEVLGRDAKRLRGATVFAIAEAREDARSETAHLSQNINEGNEVLLSDLNQSFAAVGERINSLPMVANPTPDGSLLRAIPFTGSGEDPMQFSPWLRRLEDVMRMKSLGPRRCFSRLVILMELPAKRSRNCRMRNVKTTRQSWPTSSSPSKVLNIDKWLANLWRSVDNRSANQQRYSPTACCSWLDQL
ncbi:unnamed protein product [Haemonchus placei]|uniref:t-SNARE coiled-coil homology domain-containing protein n=1 Tax=Haemonchus placei TaxID=6290 RepID=A0A0N4X062_HAEPC|nr:unnamed protein product [Haemonchus placei]